MIWLEYVKILWRPLVEIAILTIAIYYILIFVRGTRGWPVVIGFFVMLGLSFLSNLLQLEVLSLLLKARRVFSSPLRVISTVEGVTLNSRVSVAGLLIVTGWAIRCRVCMDVPGRRVVRPSRGWKPNQASTARTSAAIFHQKLFEMIARKAMTTSMRTRRPRSQSAAGAALAPFSGTRQSDAAWRAGRRPM